MAGPQLWTTGPCIISVNGKEFGTAERAPTIMIHETWTPVINDLGGPAEPFDKQEHRKHAIIRMDINRFDEAVYEDIATMVNVKIGVEGPNDVGTFMIQEDFALTVGLKFTYSSLPAFVGMPKGYTFPACTCEDQNLDPLGTVARKLGLIFVAIQKWNGRGFDFYSIL